MNWEDEGFLLSKRKFRENANIVNVFTSLFGKVSGIVYGGNSRKIRNYLQISNKIFIFYSTKNINKIGYFKTELIEAISPKYFDDKIRTTALLSLSSLLNVLLPDSQPYKNVYNSLNDLINNLNSKSWIIPYIYWELNLLKELGFDPNLKNFMNEIKYSSNLIIIKIDSIKYQVPNFLIDNNKNDNIDSNSIKAALNFTRNLMLNKFFLPNNLMFPKSRILLENYFN